MPLPSSDASDKSERSEIPRDEATSLSLTTYDREGRPVNMLEVASLLSQPDYRRVARDVVDDIVVSTVWLGIAHGDVDGKPLIFETLVFGSERDALTRRYATEAAARAGHAEVLEEVRAAHAPSTT